MIAGIQGPDRATIQEGRSGAGCGTCQLHGAGRTAVGQRKGSSRRTIDLGVRDPRKVQFSQELERRCPV